jgi:hypothetical protein
MKNTILLTNASNDRIVAIIQTNADTDEIQMTINKAKEQYYTLDEMPDGVNCEYEYVVNCLCDSFVIEITQIDDSNDVVYY